MRRHHKTVGMMNREEAKIRLQMLLTNRCADCRYGDKKCTQDCEFEQAVDMAIEALSTETVQIIQCKDCRWYEDPRKKIFENCVRGGRIIPMKPTDYCSYGKPKDGDTK